MCQRISVCIHSENVTQMFGLLENPIVAFRYNLAPTQYVPTIRRKPDGENRFDYLFWGLIPSYVNSRSFGSRMFNARSETVKEKSAFCKCIQNRRCLVLASGYYEWKLIGKSHQPMYISLKGSEPMIFAGLWDTWKSSKGEIIESCAILTTVSNLQQKLPKLSLAETHQYRMPVILPPKMFNTWLDPTITNPDELLHLYRPYPADLMQRWQVSSLVNNIKNDTSNFIEPVTVSPTPNLYD